MRYEYYEGGFRQIFSIRKLYRCYCINVDAEQKAMGTDFKSWLTEMLGMGILTEMKGE